MAAFQSVVPRIGYFQRRRIGPLLIVTSNCQCKKRNEIPRYRRVCEFQVLWDLNLHTQILGPESTDGRTNWVVRRGKTIVADSAETLLPILPMQHVLSRFRRERLHSRLLVLISPHDSAGLTL